MVAVRVNEARREGETAAVDDTIAWARGYVTDLDDAISNHAYAC
jgi:hypothetical protein